MDNQTKYLVRSRKMVHAQLYHFSTGARRNQPLVAGTLVTQVAVVTTNEPWRLEINGSLFDTLVTSMSDVGGFNPCFYLMLMHAALVCRGSAFRSSHVPSEDVDTTSTVLIYFS